MNQEPREALSAAMDDAHRLLTEAEGALKSSGRWSAVDFMTGILHLTPGRYERMETAHKKLRRARRALRRFNDACRSLDRPPANLDLLRQATAPMPPVVEVWWEAPISKGLFFLRLWRMRRAISRTRSQLKQVVAGHRSG